MSKNIKLSNDTYLSNLSLSLPVAGKVTLWGKALSLKGAYPHFLLLVRSNIYACWFSGSKVGSLSNYVINLISRKKYWSSETLIEIDDVDLGNKELKFTIERSCSETSDFELSINAIDNTGNCTITIIYIPA